MSEAQRCASVMRQYSLAEEISDIERGCLIQTAEELERQESVIAELERENEALRKDAERFRSLHWYYEQDRDMGPGGRWWTSVSTNDPKIRSDKLDVIDAALKEQSK